MRFKQILHPEIVRGTRGPAEIVASYRKLIKITEEYMEGTGGLEFKAYDSILQHHLCFVNMFLNKNRPIYHINKDFLIELAKVNRDLPLDLIPSEFFAYISFPLGTIKDESEYVQGGYASILTLEDGTRKINLSIVNEFGNEGKISDVRLSKYQFDLTGKNLNEIIASVPIKDIGRPISWSGQENLNTLRAPMVRAFLNSICYIYSSQPELMKVGSASGLSNRERARLRDTGGTVNECTVPVIFVNWRWKKPFVYHIDGTTVEGHFRWQACGPKHSERKLIFIHEHERCFERKARSKDEDSQSAQN